MDKFEEKIGMDDVREKIKREREVGRFIRSQIAKLLIEEPFYGFFLRNVEFQSDYSCASIGLFYSYWLIKCLYNPDFIRELCGDKVKAVLTHEILHIVNNHLSRRGNRDTRIWNIACDMAINPKISGLPEGALFPPKRLKGYNAEVIHDGLIYYKYIDKYVNEATIDDHESWHTFEEDLTRSRRIINEAVKAAYEKSQGRMPRFLRESVESMLFNHPQLSWKRIVRSFIGTNNSINKRKTYRRRNRRYNTFGIPGYVKRHCAHLAIAVDTSGSITYHELELFFSEIECLAEEMIDITLMLFETDVYLIKSYKRGGYKKININMRGGTDYFKVFDCIDNRGKALDGSCIRDKVDGIVILSDGYAEFPPEPKAPVLWVMTPDHNANLPPYGQKFYLK